MLEKFNLKNKDELRALLKFMVNCIKESYARNQALTAVAEALAHVATGGDSESTRALMTSLDNGLPEFKSSLTRCSGGGSLAMA